MTHPNIVEAMSRTDFYPHRPPAVDLLQTHISFIFIAGDLVYKVKKSVNYGFLDFTSLEKRRHFCREELRLNRRLAPEVYLDVVEISEDATGNLIMGPGVRTVEYAVRMKRIPEEGMLKKLIAHQEADISIMAGVAQRLADFHQKAETGGEIDAIGSIETIKVNHDENFAQTEAYINRSLPSYQFNFIKDYVNRFLAVREDLFRKRTREHRIRDCHGDLHLEHICRMDDAIIIFDCIEFNERFRYEDVAAEISFLSMDLDYNGYPEWGEAFVSAYIDYSRDRDIRMLLNFYKCYYAYVRGKVISFRMDDKAIPAAERVAAQQTAASYFDLAYTYAARLEKPALILTCGLIGTGKSVIARNIGPRLGANIIRSDVLRKELLDIRPDERHFEDFGAGIYTDAISAQTYRQTLQKAREMLEAGQPVIIDASFRRREERENAAALARQLKADFFIIECTSPDEEIKTRLEKRLLKKGEASDGRWEIYVDQKNHYERIDEFGDETHIVIDTNRKREESMNAALTALKHRLL
jgi:aminoglycoside phosphotransferase family enzyme/predicted kinase